MSVNNSTSH